MMHACIALHGLGVVVVVEEKKGKKREQSMGMAWRLAHVQAIIAKASSSERRELQKMDICV